MSADGKKYLPWRLSPYGHLAVFMFVFFMTQTTNQYIQLYLYEVGFTKTQIGLLTGTAGLIALICQPVLGGMADAASSKKRMMAVVLSIATAAFPAIYFGRGAVGIFLLYGEDAMPDPTHLSYMTALATIQELREMNTLRDDSRIYLTHINHLHTAYHARLQDMWDRAGLPNPCTVAWKLTCKAKKRPMRSRIGRFEINPGGARCFPAGPG